MSYILLNLDWNIYKSSLTELVLSWHLEKSSDENQVKKDAEGWAEDEVLCLFFNALAFTCLDNLVWQVVREHLDFLFLCPRLIATYSMVIWDTTSNVVKSALAKLSLYWPILIASSHSSTVLKLEKSGMLRSSRGRWTLRKTRANSSRLRAVQTHLSRCWVIFFLPERYQSEAPPAWLIHGPTFSKRVLQTSIFEMKWHEANICSQCPWETWLELKRRLYH